MKLDAIQAALQQAQLDGWLFYDHHHRDPIAYRILGLSESLHISRRWYYFVPATGEPRKLVHRVEGGRLDPLPGKAQLYSSWQELEAGLRQMLTGPSVSRCSTRRATPSCMSRWWMREPSKSSASLGKTIVSSADLVSRFEAVLTPEQEKSHFEAQGKLDAILEAGFREIGRRVRSAAGTNEYEMVQWLQRAMADAGLVWEHGPNVSVNANSSDGHYEPTEQAHAPIRSGDFLLIDIWARLNREATVFYDITWTGVVDREPTPQEQASSTSFAMHATPPSRR